jgi:hypothetical protein
MQSPSHRFGWRRRPVDPAHRPSDSAACEAVPVREASRWAPAGNPDRDRRADERGSQAGLASAEVHDGKLVIALEGEQPKGWADGFERIAYLLNQDTWEKVKLLSESSNNGFYAKSDVM